MATPAPALRRSFTRTESILISARPKPAPPGSEDIDVDDPATALADARHDFGEHGGVNVSIEASATFRVLEPESMRQMFDGELAPEHELFLYSRHFNPTVMSLGRQMAALEGTEAAYCTASGISAISTVLLRLCSSGDHIVAADSIYGEGVTLLSEFIPRLCNITTTFVDITDHAAVREAIVEGKTKVLYFESMSNPIMTVADIPELARIGHDKGVTVFVDNTFAPMILSPARLGADVVVHSVSKFISGAGDIIAGAICGTAEFVNSLMDPDQGPLVLLGPTMNPKIAFELSERVPHLSLTMKEICKRALTFATRLKKMGVNIIYPGLEDHPQHELLKSMANKGYGFGALIGVDMGSVEKANELMYLLQNYSQFGFMAASLGHYETLLTCSGLTVEEKVVTGMSDGFVRISVGYLGTLEQRWSQFEKALLKMINDRNLPRKN